MMARRPRRGWSTRPSSPLAPCGVSDPNDVLRASALCDELGMDAISAGGTVAWAMECRERGVDLGVPADEIPRWGDGAAVLRTLTQIGAGRTRRSAGRGVARGGGAGRSG